MPKCTWCGDTFDELPGDGDTHDLGCSRELAKHNKAIEDAKPKKNNPPSVAAPAAPIVEDIVVAEPKPEEPKPKPEPKKRGPKKKEQPADE